MDDARREALQEQLLAFDAAGAPFRAALKKIDEQGLIHRAALASINGAREYLLTGLGVEIAGACEHCKRLLLAGDIGSKPHGDAAGTVYCEEHTPTWRDMLSTLPADPADDDEDCAEFRRDVVAGEYDLDSKAGLHALEAELEVP